MSNPIAAGLDNAEQATIRRAARHATGEEPERRDIGAETKAAAEPEEPPFKPEMAPANPYAPTGWRKKQRVDFDVTLPSGQLCRVLRLEREDLFRLNLMSYLDTFTPMLMEDSISTEERNRRMQETMTKHPDSIANMFMAIDEVVMAATIRPRVTNDEKKVDYGGPQDWGNPQFIATAYIEDISMEDRMAIFASAFGRSMDDLKSIWNEAGGVASMADGSSVQPTAE
jgi:plasmid stability protein